MGCKVLQIVQVAEVVNITFANSAIVKFFLPNQK